MPAAETVARECEARGDEPISIDLVTGEMRRRRSFKSLRREENNLGTMFKSANRERFLHWIKRSLLPKLRLGDIVVLDNAQAHKDARLPPLLRSHGAALRFLPPYSPDFNPIEPAWSLVKKWIRAAAPRTRLALRRVAQNSRRVVSPTHCFRWTRHAGYRRGLN